MYHTNEFLCNDLAINEESHMHRFDFGHSILSIRLITFHRHDPYVKHHLYNYHVHCSLSTALGLFDEQGAGLV